MMPSPLTLARAGSVHLTFWQSKMRFATIKFRLQDLLTLFLLCTDNMSSAVQAIKIVPAPESLQFRRQTQKDKIHWDTK